MKVFSILAFSTLILTSYSAYSTTPAVKKTEIKPAVTTEVKPEVKISDIPSITTPDRTPHACVDCHKNYTEMKMDARLKTVLAKWQTGADPEIVAKAQAAAPGGRKLTGKHPDIQALVKTIPDDCLMCHVQSSVVAPPFSKLLHAIHLVGGKDNHFLTMANGTCTSCHNLTRKQGRGVWEVARKNKDTASKF